MIHVIHKWIQLHAHGVLQCVCVASWSLIFFFGCCQCILQYGALVTIVWNLRGSKGNSKLKPERISMLSYWFQKITSTETYINHNQNCKTQKQNKKLSIRHMALYLLLPKKQWPVLVCVHAFCSSCHVINFIAVHDLAEIVVYFMSIMFIVKLLCMFLFYLRHEITPKRTKSKTIDKHIVTFNCQCHLRSSGRCSRDAWSCSFCGPCTGNWGCGFACLHYGVIGPDAGKGSSTYCFGVNWFFIFVSLPHTSIEHADAPYNSI